MSARQPSVAGPADPDERYRLYIDESGDHMFKKLAQPSHRFLCLIGCLLRGREYRRFHDQLEKFKQKHIPHSPDQPVILHRADIMNRRGCFWRLRDLRKARAFDDDLLTLVKETDFRIVAIVIDKLVLKQKYPAPAHPYHLALGYMLQRYCGLLNHINRRGDVLAESRGGREDRLLKDSYSRVLERGVWMTRPEFFQRALTSRELKLKPKSANIAGLQLSDMIGHPVRQSIVIEKGMLPGPLGPFAARLIPQIQDKFNRHLYDGRVWGYGKLLTPE